MFAGSVGLRIGFELVARPSGSGLGLQPVKKINYCLSCLTRNQQYLSTVTAACS